MPWEMEKVFIQRRQFWLNVTAMVHTGEEGSNTIDHVPGSLNLKCLQARVDVDAAGCVTAYASDWLAHYIEVAKVARAGHKLEPCLNELMAARIPILPSETSLDLTGRPIDTDDENDVAEPVTESAKQLKTRAKKLIADVLLAMQEYAQHSDMFRLPMGY